MTNTDTVLGVVIIAGMAIVALLVVLFIARALFILIAGIVNYLFSPKPIPCDCITRVQHYGFFFVGEAGYSLIPDRDCPKCNGTGTVDPKSPYANKPSPVRGRPPNPALVAATGAAAASIAAAAMRHDDWHHQHQRQLDDDRRSRDDMLH